MPHAVTIKYCLQWPCGWQGSCRPGFATFSNLEMQHSPKIFFNFLQKVLAKNRADDYIEKPYDIDILLAKIRGIFKRKYAIEEIVEDNFKLNTVNRILFVDGKEIGVTEKEFELLKLLIENKNVTLRKEYIFNTIWGSDSDSELQTLTVHIKWLRQKIEKDPKKPTHIITEWGVGYRFE